MKPIKLTFLTIVAASLAASGHAATLFFDFGDRSTPTTNAANFYNNIDQDQLPIADCVDDAGNNTGVSATPSGFNPGSNGNGTQTPTGAASIFAPAATRDNLFGHTGIFGGLTLPLGTIVLTGLDSSGNTSYSFTFFGSRNGVSDNRETKYEVVGLNTAFSLLNTANNTANVATVAGITPDGSGNVTINVNPGPNNNNGSGFFYIAAIRMVSANTAQPVITVQPTHKTLSPGATTNFTVTATSATAISYQWQLNNTNLVNGGNISGATNATLTVSGVSTADVGHYRVLVSNNAGTTTSADAVLALQRRGYYPTATVVGKLGESHRVDDLGDVASTNWSVLGTKTLASTPELFVDANSLNATQHFYRALCLANGLGQELLNAGFESPETGFSATSWTKFGAVNRETWAARTDTNGMAFEWWVGASGGVYQDVAGNEGAEYTLSAWYQDDAAAVVTSVYTTKFEWFDINDAFLGNSTTNITPLLNDTWQQLDLVATAPVGTAKVRVVFTASDMISGETLKIDDVSLAPSLIPGFPVITNQPVQHQTVSTGATATFNVGVSNPVGASYQWLFYNTNLVDGGSISGATSPALTITGVTAADVGHYRVQVINGAGTAYSAEATLTIAGIGFYPAVTVTGKIGDTYRVDYAEAPTPTTWISLSTNVLTSASRLVIDSTSPNSNTRLYRAVYQP